MELLPCPHCGKTPRLHSLPGVSHAGRDWNIHCDTAGCFNYITEDSRYKDMLISAWNKRAPSLPALPDIKEEEKTLEEPGDVAANTVQGPMELTLAYGVEAALGNAERVLGCIVRALDHGALSMNPATLAPDIRQAAARIAVVMNSVRASTVPEAPKSSTGSEFPQSRFETGGRNALNLELLAACKALPLAAFEDEDNIDAAQFVDECNSFLTAMRLARAAIAKVGAASDGKEQGAELGKPEAQ
jgi:hypothetical protein